MYMNQNAEQNFRLILASGSPRRRELLTQMGYSFEIIVPDVDEDVSGHARDVVGILSRRKAEAVAREQDHGIVIASDTLVSLNGQALGKPHDAQDAHRMLRLLSGKTHEVFTGVTIIDAASGKRETQVVRTGVIFREVSDEEIHAYIATKEPMDKAGSYGIQGRASIFAEALHGDYFNVMGLPLCRLTRILRQFGVSVLGDAETR